METGSTKRLWYLFDLFSVNGGQLRVSVLDPAGQEIATLLEQPAIAGPYSAVWDGRNGSGETVPPGIYLVRVEVDETGAYSDK